jgi:Putative auto-transporter adhesin, head GIN domain
MNTKYLSIIAAFIAPSLSAKAENSVTINGKTYSGNGNVVVVDGKIIQGLENSIKGSGIMKEQKKELKAFSKINLKGHFNVILTCQKPQEVVVKADDNIIPLITAEVQDDTLFVESKSSFSTTQPPTLLLSVLDMHFVLTSGSGTLSLNNVDTEKLDIEIIGSMDLTADGKVKNGKIIIAGSGNVHASNLKMDNASVQISGSGNVDVFATEQVDATIYGTGNILHSGDPKKVKPNVFGIGKVENR